MVNRSLSFRAPLLRRFFIPASVLVLSAGLASAIPWAPKEDSEKHEDEFNEIPNQLFIDPRSETAESLQAPEPKSVKAFESSKSIRGVVGWTFRGPSPIPNGQTLQRTDPVNGRINAIAVHPTNPNIAYAGAASGGLYRTLDGGVTWTQLMDTASTPSAGLALAIGAVTIDPVNPARVYVGTGEANFCIDCQFGSGFYIITGADTGSPTVTGPFNASSGVDPAGGVAAGTDVFTGRAFAGIAVDPTNTNNIYVATGQASAGIRNVGYSVLPRQGLYRSTDGGATWTRLQVGGTATSTQASAVMLDPQNPNTLLVTMASLAAGDPSGVYRTTNATAVTPTFTQSLALPINSSTVPANSKLAVGFSPTLYGGATVFYATSAENAPTSSAQGKLYKSTDAGANFVNLPAVNGFAATQGFYDVAVGCDPNNPDAVSVGGQAANKIFERSTDGGATFTIDPANGPYTITAGLHADVHAITYAKSNGSVIYHGNDGGIWQSTDGGNNWVARNAGGLSATQFSGIALHPTDRDFTLSGSQDNGTSQIRPGTGAVQRVDFGDGGYSLIDQNAPDTTNVVQYHTYFNQRLNLIGTGRVLNNPCATDGQWSFHGIYGGGLDTTTVYCDGSKDTFNGISITENVQFYGPMALGPGNPNTWYFGTDRLWRSTDRADTATAQTGFLGDFVNDIAISPQDDNVRLLGTNGSDGTGVGSVWATTTGGAMVKIAGTSATNGPGVLLGNATFRAPVTRVLVDPNNKNVGYIGFGGFGTPASPFKHLWRVGNLDALNTGGTVGITATSNGLPDVPINSLAIDPQSGSATRTSTDIYVGTDIGVYRSTNAGATFTAFNPGLPRVPVFGLAVQNPNRLLRAATHGRGWYDIGITASAPAAPAAIAAFSRKVHGASGVFDLSLPLTGQSGIEPRRDAPGGASYTLVVRFTNTIASGTAMASGGSATAGTPSFSGTDMIVPLNNVTNLSNVTVTLSNVTDTNGMTLASTAVTIGFNAGDVSSADRTVNSGDIQVVKNNSGKTVGASTFTSDINCDGFINSADVQITKNNSGNGPLP